ncbi:MAG TPA: DNA mismatch repair protein MutS, partial [Thermoanaerobacterales bacterium]|nr:DNA mismatch repair protein MutS [Thermoanaerobacterales bacterium]
ASLEKKEKEKTGIRSLKIGFNKVFGYYIDVTKSNLSLVPDRYIRKQTLVNSERYITAELKELEAKILGAEEKIEVIEYNLFTSIRDTITMHIERIQKTAKIIAVLDVLTSFAEISGLNNYTKPQIIDNGEIEIKNGRHPVVELVLQDEFFVPNDIYLDQNENQMLIITGPNMAGKSTYMRQVALIVLMAQIGCFVPADNARISIVDRIFTRIGATDDLAAGDSTFMVEMKEVALILREATNKSLIVLDEVGRGTSTYDGMSIAWAVVEYIHEHIRAKTLFATHYHELTNLENKLLKVKNYSIAVKEKGDDVVFLRKVVKGGADKSYGVHVAHLAGLPQKVINNAQKIIKDLEGNEKIQKSNPSNGLHVKNSKHCIKVENKQLKIANYAHEQILEEINALDILTITPIEALNFLYEIKKKVNNIEG